ADPRGDVRPGGLLRRLRLPPAVQLQGRLLRILRLRGLPPPLRAAGQPRPGLPGRRGPGPPPGGYAPCRLYVLPRGGGAGLPGQIRPSGPALYAGGRPGRLRLVLLRHRPAGHRQGRGAGRPVQSHGPGPERDGGRRRFGQRCGDAAGRRPWVLHGQRQPRRQSRRRPHHRGRAGGRPGRPDRGAVVRRPPGRAFGPGPGLRLGGGVSGMSFAPVYGPGSRALIQGSWPSPKSWDMGFYYGHPHNRFCPLLARLTGEALPAREDVAAKRKMILDHGLALWDVLASCTIEGASDASIRDAVPEDIGFLLARAPVEAVFCNGAAAYRLYVRYMQPVSGIGAVRLPSTSPANAAWSLDRLQEAWGAALGPYLGKKEGK